MQINQFDLIKSRRFLPLFITQFLGAFNVNVFHNALAILITYKIAAAEDINAQFLVTLAAGIFILPFFLFSATAGQLADKYQKSRLIILVKVFEILFMGCAAIGFYAQSIPMLIFVLFLLGVQAAFFGPLKYAILPEQLREGELIAGNGIIEAGTFVSILLGIILGGSLILYPLGAIIISLIICTVSICGFISSLYIPETPYQNPALKINFNFIQETLRLIRYSNQSWDIFLAILGISWFWLVGSVFLAELPVFTKSTLQANQYVVSLFYAVFSIGIGIGSLLCNRLLKGKVYATYVPLGALGMTIFTVDLYFASRNAVPPLSAQLITLEQFILTTNGLRITFDLLLIAIFGGLYTVPLYAIMQQFSDPSHRARVIASNNVLNALFMVFAAVGTMFLLTIGATVSQVFLVIAIGNGLVAVYICRLWPEALLRPLLIWVFKTLYKVEVIGMENYANAGNRVVIVSNHTSFLDAALLAAFLPDKLTYAIDTLTSNKWWIKIFLRLVDAYPMDPTNSMAIKSLIEFIRTDKRCVIFPEGRLTMTGALMKIYEGPGLVADKSGAKLLPVRIHGAQFTHFSRLKGKERIRWTPKITITIFPAQELDIPPHVKGRERRQQISIKLYELMTFAIFESSDYRQTLFHSLIDAKVTHSRSHKFIEDIERNPISYQQFITRSFILGNIIAKKTKPGENVGVLLPNMVTTAIVFFALLTYGRVPAMLNFSTGIKNIKNACLTAQIKTVYTSEKFVNFAKLNDMVAAIRELGINVIYLEQVRAKVHILRKLKGLLMAQFPMLAYKMVNRSRASRAMLSPEAPAVVLFTSGSEGAPKGVVLSHKNIQANRFQVSACVDFTSSDRMLNALPLFHSFGLTAGLLLPMLAGVKTFLYPSPLHYKIVPELSYDISATILFGTDTFLTGYARHANPYDFYSIRYVFAGAEKLRNETRTIWMHKFGIRILEGYGVTETSPVLAINTPMQNKIGTVGRILPGIEYHLDKVPGIDEGGVLVVRGPNVMKGYLRVDNPGVITPLVDGWYSTGDVVTIDPMGFVTIKDRVKRFAKIAGEMVSLAMVEQQITQLWPEFQHAVVNIPDQRKGEQLVLVTTNPHATREAIVAFAKAAQMGDIAIPKKLIMVKMMPLLGSGKVDYAAVKELVLTTLAAEPETNEEDDADTLDE